MLTNAEAIKMETAEPVELRDLARVLFKRLWVLPITTTLCVAAGILTILYWTPSYETQVRMQIVGTPKVASAYYNGYNTQEDLMAGTYAEIMTNQDVLRDVVNALQLQDRDAKQYDSALKLYTLRLRDWSLERWKDLKAWYTVRIQHKPAGVETKDKVMKAVEDLEKAITVEGVDKSDVVSITVSDPDPVMAARIGNALAHASILFNLRQELNEMSAKYGSHYPTNREIKDAIQSMTAHLADFNPDVKADFGAGNIKIVQHAFPPTEHKKPKRKYLLLGSLLGGLLGGGFLIFLLEKIDPTFGSTAEVRRELNLPFIGSVPEKVWKRDRRLIEKERDREFYLEALLPLAYRIQALRAKAGVRTICFSATHMTANDSKLAQALAFCLSRLDAEHQEGTAGKVLFVESDVKKEQLLSRAAVASGDRKSMTDYVEGQAEMDQAIACVDPLLSITTLNGSTPSSLHALHESKYRSFLNNARTSYDLIVFQGPAFSRPVDFTFVSALCDATVLIVDEGQTRKKAVGSMLKELQMNQTKVLGVIVNNQKHHIPRFLYNWV